MVSLRSARTADATLAYAPPRLSPRRRFAVRSAHSCSHTRFARTLARTPWAGTRAMWCRFAPNKKTQGYIVSKLLKYNYDIFIQVFINKY